MEISLLPSKLGDRTYLARGFEAPSRLPDGEPTVRLADLFLDICRGQDPNIPGFSAASSVPAYTLWPYLRYSPLVADTWDFRLIEGVRGIDGRKKGIIAEDLGIGFSVGACDMLGGLPVITKWEAAQESRRDAWAAQIASEKAIPIQDAVQVSIKLGGTLSGADFVGYSTTERAWLICESKGSLERPRKPESILSDLRDSNRDLGVTASGEPRKPEPLLKGIRQKRDTAAAAAKAGVSVVPLLVYTSAATAADRHVTTVDYIDPDPTSEQLQVLGTYGEFAADFIAAAHYEWVAAVLGLEGSPWGNQLARRDTIQIPRSRAQVAYSRVVRLDLAPDLTVQVLIGIAADLVEILERRDVAGLREWSANRRLFRSDGLLVQILADDDRRRGAIIDRGRPSDRGGGTRIARPAGAGS
jgi:hypothetical protein